jgi:hypothetical protein
VLFAFDPRLAGAASILSSGEMVVARKKMKIFTYGMIDQLHKRSIFGPPGQWPVRLSFFTTLR